MKCNQEGSISKTNNKSIEQENNPGRMMKQVLNLKSMKELFQNALHDNSGKFIAGLIDLYSSDSYLQKCAASDVAKEALKAASLNLPINKQMGLAYIVPYYDNKLKQYIPQFQIGYKGYINLCIRSGIYRTINAGVVYEGEFVKEDKLTGKVDLSGQKTEDTVIGYFAYMETLNGFSKCLYWTKDKVTKHAEQYSKSYKNAGSAWKSNFDEMAKKTVLRNLLSKYGLLSVEIEFAEMETNMYSEVSASNEENPESSKTTLPPNESNIAALPEAPEQAFIDIGMNSETGEVVELELVPPAE